MNFKKVISVVFLSMLAVSCIVAQTDFENGKSLYEQGDYEGAKVSFIKAIDQDEAHREALMFLGVTYARLGIDELAVKSLKKSLAIRMPKPKEDVSDKRPKILSKLGGAFSDLQRKDKVRGSIKVIAEFNKDGVVTFVYPYEKLTDAMTDSAVKAAYKIKFEPATKNGKKITIMQMIEYQLRLI